MFISTDINSITLMVTDTDCNDDSGVCESKRPHMCLSKSSEFTLLS